jgi:hypothetical protein
MHGMKFDCDLRKLVREMVVNRGIGLKDRRVLRVFRNFAAIIVYLLRFGFSHLFDVVIGREGLDVVVFRRAVIATIPYSSIERAERRWIFLSIDASAPWSVALPITNRVGLRVIIIKFKRRIGIFHHIAITPKDLVRFLEELQSYVPASGGDLGGRVTGPPNG